MIMYLEKNSFLIFDLDDTLYQEIDFLKSGYRHISHLLGSYLEREVYNEMLECYRRGENTFEWLIQEYGEQVPGLSLPSLQYEYRYHKPFLQLAYETKIFLERLKNLNVPCGLITDGRGLTQRNKLEALGLLNYFRDIIISEEFGTEKPEEKNYLFFSDKYIGDKFYYIGDNTSKDFIVPAKLGWFTICLRDNGNNIHTQDLKALPIPELVLASFADISDIILLD